jgi:hypothetical protein
LTKISEIRKQKGLPINQVEEKTSNNIEEEYDEELQQRLFREAVEAFRTGKNISDLLVEKAEIETEPITDLLPANKEKRCCWNCLKVLIKEDCVEHVFSEKVIKNKVVINLILIHFCRHFALNFA